MCFPKLANFMCIAFTLITLVHSAPSPALNPLHISIHKSQKARLSRLNRRSFESIDLLHQSDVYYSAVLEIGTPSQEVSVVLDTGSADLWVASSSNPFCLTEDGSTYSNQTYDGHTVEPSINCSSFGTFDTNLSSSLSKLDIGRFFINYSDGSLADGYWANEKMSVSGIDLSTLQFAIADYATAPVGGVFGIGFPRRESVRGYENAPGQFYPNFPQVLKNNGIVDVVAYSLYIGGTGGESGSILFGAVDPNKYTGSLYTFPMVNEYPEVVNKPATLAMTLQAIGAKSDKNCRSKTISTTKLAVLLDSGTTYMSAPPQIADEMASFVGATFSKEEGVYVFECPSDNDDTEFVFDFGDLKINVPLSSLVLLPPSNGYCGFGVMPASYSMTLGSVFLSSAYVVYDLDNYQISLAQAKHDESSSQANLVKIPENGNIPDATTATATVWTTDEPIAVDYDIFDGELMFCKKSSNQTNSSTLVDLNTSDSKTWHSPPTVSTDSLTMPGNTTLSLQMSATHRSSSNPKETSSDSTALKDQAASTEVSFRYSPQYVTVTHTVTATETISPTIDCHNNRS